MIKNVLIFVVKKVNLLLICELENLEKKTLPLMQLKNGNLVRLEKLQMEMKSA